MMSEGYQPFQSSKLADRKRIQSSVNPRRKLEGSESKPGSTNQGASTNMRSRAYYDRPGTRQGDGLPQSFSQIINEDIDNSQQQQST
jgi:hypothetical protein